jgi:hypothetical protein
VAAETVKVDLVDLWDGQNPHPDHLATIVIRLARPVGAVSAAVRHVRKFVIARQVKRRLQQLLKQKGSDLRIQRVRVEELSVEIWVILGGATAALWHFFKDYKDFRDGVIAFISDVKAVAGDIHEIVDSKYEPAWPFRSVHQGASVRTEQRTREVPDTTPVIPGETIWVSMLQGAGSVIVGAVVFQVSSLIISGIVGSLLFLLTSWPTTLPDLVTQIGFTQRAVYFAIDFGCAFLAGLVAGAIATPPKIMWGLLTGIVSFLFTLWLATTFPNLVFVTPPRLLDFAFVVFAATFGTYVAAE